MKSPPRVVHVVPALFGDGGVFGGAERFALELARHMAESHPTRLVTFSEAPARQSRRSARRPGSRPTVAGPRAAVQPFPSRAGPPSRLGKRRPLSPAGCRRQQLFGRVLPGFRPEGVRQRPRRRRVGHFRLCPHGRWFHGHLHISEYSRSLAGHAGWDRAHVISAASTPNGSPLTRPSRRSLSSCSSAGSCRTRG